MSTGSGFTPNITFDRTAGSHALAAAGQRVRSADKGLEHGYDEPAEWLWQ
jgi:hypothetical protein